jgi:hypothetical protein
MPALQSLAFEANDGQAPADVKFLARAGKHQLLLTARSLTLRSLDGPIRIEFAGLMTQRRRRESMPYPVKGITCSATTQKSGTRESQLFSECGTAIYIPAPTSRSTATKTNLNMTLSLGRARTRARFVCESIARRGRAFPGAGDLFLKRGEVEVTQRKPIVYQEIDGERHVIEGRYRLLSRHEIGFQIGAYDRTRPLIIDPTLVYSTYLGGGGDDSGSSIAIDGSGNVYVDRHNCFAELSNAGPGLRQQQRVGGCLCHQDRSRRRKHYLFNLPRWQRA